MLALRDKWDRVWSDKCQTYAPERDDVKVKVVEPGEGTRWHQGSRSTDILEWCASKNSPWVGLVNGYVSLFVGHGLQSLDRADLSVFPPWEINSLM